MTARDSQQLGQLIRRHRVTAALSQEELAERSGISARAVSDLERGLRSSPRLETMRMLAGALELDDADRDALLAAARPDALGQETTNRDEPAVGEASRPTVVPLKLLPLPAPPTRLIGRDDLIQHVAGLLRGAEVRLVTLAGPGGVGKTRLALAVGMRLGPYFEDGAALIDCASLTHAEQVPGAVASALGIFIDTGMSPLESLSASLRNRSLLLLLDNLEHLLDAAGIVAGLLAACPRLRVLVTSRSRLRLRGEHVVQVEPLEVPGLPADAPASLDDLLANPAVRLFLERAGEVSARLELTGRTAADIVGICRRLDGLPLAIELAAARAALLSPAALLARLEHSLGILTEGARDAPDRQRTLRDTIGWSYDLLTPSEQAFFRKSAVFSGGFTLEGAEAVAAEPGEDALAIVMSLFEKNLIRKVESASGESRFAMLETIREFGLDRLVVAGEEASARQRHFDYFLQLSERFDDACLAADDEVRWFARMDDDAENLRSALKWKNDTADTAAVPALLAAGCMYWYSRPYDRDIHLMLERYLARDHHDLPPEVVVRARLLGVWLAAETGDLDQMLIHARTGLEAAIDANDRFLLGVGYAGLAVGWEIAGDCEQSAAAWRESLDAFQQVPGRASQVATARDELGDRLVLCGDLDEGVRLIDEAIHMHTQLGSENGLSAACGERGHAARIQGDAALARRMFIESIVHSEQVGDAAFALGAIVGLAGVELMEDRPEEAARLLGAAEAARESLGLTRMRHPLHSQQIIAAVRERLGDEAYEQRAAEGSRIPYDELLARALGTHS